VRQAVFDLDHAGQLTSVLNAEQLSASEPFISHCAQVTYRGSAIVSDATDICRGTENADDERSTGGLRGIGRLAVRGLISPERLSRPLRAFVSCASSWIYLLGYLASLKLFGDNSGRKAMKRGKQ
jgi:hypothetical protein